MPQLKQKTVSVGKQKQTVALKKKKNGMDRGGEWMYTIEDADTGALLEDPFTNKRDARKAFRQAVKDIERGMESFQKETEKADMGLGSTGSLTDPLDNDLL